MTKTIAPTPEQNQVWQGALDVGGGNKPRVVLRISVAADGALSGTLDSIDQGALNLPIDTITLQDQKLHFEMKAIGASFDGTLNADGTKIAGTWNQSGAAAPLIFEKSSPSAITAATKRPQDPTKPYPYNEEEVSFKNDAAGDTLAGTLTLPRSGGPYAAVVLITGSGAQDRNEELLNHRPFLVLADYLTRQGIAVLRYDDRGFGKSTGDFSKATSADFATDVQTAIEFLKSRKEIDPTRIGLIGHSEGGLIAPMVAAHDSDVSFIILMAGTGVPGSDVIEAQWAAIERAQGVGEAAIAKAMDLQKRIDSVVKEENDDTLAASKIRELFKETETWTAEEKSALGSDESNADALITTLLSPWFRFFLSYDPAPTLRSVKCPVLVLNGERDLQVLPSQNLLPIAAELEAGGNADYTIIKFPKLNHLFQTSTTGSPNEYSKIEETISPSALKIMGDWILAHTQKK
ncbi:alpha/beta fold hydrolase [Candidatus Acetothermia bacterium]|nr:alpha/beta fold hydrolase [Candidatus Acetothermia bacterium]MBI3643028.1 alpha/beta fold hydrolase [Candidatus Acetothermia bacterium]